MNIDKYKTDDGYINEDGISFEDAEQFLQSGIMGFCMCGMPDESLRFVRNALNQIQRLQLMGEKQISYDDWKKENKILYRNQGIEYFTYYVFSNKGLTEHGSSVPGWLTKKGVELLEDLNEFFKNE